MARPNSRVEIVAAMRRIRVSFYGSSLLLLLPKVELAYKVYKCQSLDGYNCLLRMPIKRYDEMTQSLFRTGGLHASSNNQNTKAGQINEQIAYKMK